MEFGLMTLKELAKEFGVCDRTIRNWMKAGLPARYTPGSARIFFAKEEVQAWIKTLGQKYEGPRRTKESLTNQFIAEVIEFLEEFAEKGASGESMVKAEKLRKQAQDLLIKEKE
jgi:DNA-binding transcriptional MerR regulator